MGFKIKQQPLYLQVKKKLVQQIMDKEYPPGMVLPNEVTLARLFGVSQGTVRRALDELTEENIVSRRQGVGTFVTQETASSALSVFFRLYPDENKEEVVIQSELISKSLAKPNKEEKAIFACESIVRIVRKRILNGVPVIVEYISIPGFLFAGIEKQESLPDALYPLFQSEYQIKIAGAKDRIKAVLSTPEIENFLDIKKNTPILLLNRLAYDLNDRVVEIRKSYAISDHYYYSVQL